MRFFIHPFIVAVVLSASLIPATAQPSYDNYQLVWSDEFETSGLPGSANWGYEKGCSVRNSELQYYAEAREKNSRIESGSLIIEAHQESMSGCNYTSASLITRGKREFQYGILEMRAKIDVRKGSWPAFWTLGVTEEWPSNGEVDIMEYYNGLLHANVAWGTNTRWEGKWDSQTKSVGSDFATGFHIWRMHWTESFIDLWVDDVKQNTTDLSTTINGNLATLKNPFHQKAYIVINQAIGANGGDPAGTAFPIRYVIDYVRVYQEGKDTFAPTVLSVSRTGSLLLPPLKVSVMTLDGRIVARKCFTEADGPVTLAKINRTVMINRSLPSGISVISVEDRHGRQLRYTEIIK